MAAHTMTLFITVSIFSNLVSLARASEFLKAPVPESERISEEDIRISLLDEVEGSLGAGSASSRLAQLEALLKPIAAVLPKNSYGNLGHSAVRYALHRVFVLRHGWVIAGLGTADGIVNASSPSGVITNQVPAYIEQMFEKRLAGKGFGLHELSVLAATIEHLIHNEAVSKLGAAFNIHNLPVTSPISEIEAKEALDSYMIAYILGMNLNNMTLGKVQKLHASMPEIFPAWKDTEKFVHDVRANVTKDVTQLDFAALATVAEKVGEQYGTFQNLECSDLKDKLMKMEYRGTGRVQLADFYKPALSGKPDAWQFSESVAYLRQLGLLDESDPSQPSVLIANYLTSSANCIASSGFYSVCCKNECENLLGHLEENIGASETTPATIVALVKAGLPSSTVKSPQEVSANLLQRLDEIAAGHAGKVPLHGRLFAQWMHHVYPRECPYPHMSGTTTAASAEEWMEQTGGQAVADEDEMKQFVRASDATVINVDQPQGDLAVEDLMPWSGEEELFVLRPAHLDVKASASAPMRSMALVAAAGSLALSLTRMMKTTIDSHVLTGGSAASKYIV